MPREMKKYKPSVSEASQLLSIQTKTPEENRIDDSLLLIRYNIKKCIKIILDDCMTSKSFSPEIKKEIMPHVKEENISVRNENNENRKSETPSSEDVYNTFQLKKSQNGSISSSAEEKATESNASEVKTEEQPESKNGSILSSAEEKASESNASEVKTEEQPETGRLQIISNENDETNEAYQVNEESNGT